MTIQDDEAAVIRLEHARCEAISTGDLQALDALLDDALTHTHANGRIQHKAAYLQALAGRPRHSRRVTVAVRVLGDAAIMTGTLRNTATRPASSGPSDPSASVDLTTLQVWVRRGPDWLLAAFSSSGPLRAD